MTRPALDRPNEDPTGPRIGDLISICIPTCDRPGFLRTAIESCLIQEHRPLEILIGDDSRDDAAADMLRTLPLPDGVTLERIRNRPSLGQSGNVNGLLARAAGRRLILLHDDDVLCPGAIAELTRAWSEHPGIRCAYGKQYMIDESGQILAETTQTWNRTYARHPEASGRQPSALVAGLLQQIPNNGYLMETELARSVGLRPEPEIGQCVDADFGVRAGIEAGRDSFVFVDAFTSAYRLTAESIARSQTINRRQDLFFAYVSTLHGDPAVEAARDVLLRRIAIGATLDAALAGRRRDALRILFSSYYDKPFASRWTLYRLLCVVLPRLGPRLRGLVRHREMTTATALAILSGSIRALSDLPIP